MLHNLKSSLVNNRLKRMCKEAIVAQLRYYSGVYLKCVRKTANSHDRLYFISGLQTMKLDIRTRASYRIQTIIHISEEDKIIENIWKTLL
jgi:hypothetical protein